MANPPSNSTPEPPLELFGDITGNCLRAAIALEEAGLPYRVRRIQLNAGQQHHVDYLALNPLGKVPTLVDHRSSPPITVSQSNAIIFHAADHAPGTILPVELGAARSLALQTFFFFVTEVICVNFDSSVVRRHHEATAARVLQGRGLAALLSAERHVAIAPYMAGDTFSIADIAALTVVHSFAHHFPWDEAPALKRWYQSVVARPAVQRGLHAFD